MSRELINDDEQNRCFGCSPHNEQGLRLVFTEHDDGVEARYEVPEHMVGPPGAVHGGIQAVLLDEVMGMSARVGVAEDAGLAVTAELGLRYRRPVPVGLPLRIRGRFLRREDRNLFVEGEIRGPDDAVLTTAEARFVYLPPASE